MCDFWMYSINLGVLNHKDVIYQRGNVPMRCIGCGDMCNPVYTISRAQVHAFHACDYEAEWDNAI